MSSFTSGLELYANVLNNANPGYLYTSATDTGNTAALPAPISIPFTVTNANNLTNVNLNIAGSLVTISGAFFGTNAGNVMTIILLPSPIRAGQRFQVQTFALDADTSSQVYPAYASSVTGILYGINTNFTVAVTRFADIVAASPPPSTIIPTISAGVTGISLVNGNVVINGRTGRRPASITCWRARILRSRWASGSRWRPMW